MRNENKNCNTCKYDLNNACNNSGYNRIGNDDIGTQIGKWLSTFEWESCEPVPVETPGACPGWKAKND